MSATAEMVARLRRMVAESSATTYSDADLRGYIERYPIMDGLGHEPYETSMSTPFTLIPNDDWTDTYDLNAAAGDVWAEKAAALANEFDFTTAGASFSRSQQYTNCMYQSRYYRARRAAKTIRQYPAPRREDSDLVANSEDE